jgi:acyl-CoA thioesterase-1
LLGELHGRVLRFRPDVTSIMMGMNDCVDGGAGREDYRRNLLALVDAIEARASLLLLHTPNPIRPGSDAERTDLAQYAEIVHEVAAERNVLLVDHYESWMAQERKRPGALGGWLDADGIHPNAAGHREFARLFFVRLGIFAADSLTCKLCSEDAANIDGSV